MRRKVIQVLLVLMVVVLVICAAVSITVWQGARTVRDVLGDSRELRKALSTLMAEEQIGYAKVVAQESRDGRVFTTLKFVETDPAEPINTVFQREFTVEGDVVHFDALIIQFPRQMVLDGNKRALYLWRRVYGEGTPPAQGQEIDPNGQAPARYDGLLEHMPAGDQSLFWQGIWELSDSPDALKEYGISAVYGNAVYKRMRPGLIYVFKLTSTGHFYPETVPDL